MQKNAFFLKRLNDHIQYLRRIKERLEGKNDFEPTACTRCALGQWLYGEGRAEAAAYGGAMQELFRQLLEPHEQFHLASSEALRCQQAGNEFGMRRAMTEMYRLSSTLVTLLLRMDSLRHRVNAQAHA